VHDSTGTGAGSDKRDGEDHRRQDRQIRLILTALFAEGHVLLDDLPGVGKTTLVKTLAIATGCRSRRIQFVPDLLPSDIVGMNIYDQRLSDFRLLPGPS
jgi:MoxR-like ATPase